MSKTYVITGATGHTGRPICEGLLALGHTVKAIARDTEKLSSLAEKGAEIHSGSLEDHTFLSSVFSGADAVYVMVPPNLTAEDMRVYQNNVVDAFVEAFENTQVPYAVTLSSVGAHMKEGSGVVQGLFDMEQKFNLLDHTNILHLRPAFFMENLLWQGGTIKQMGIMGSPLNGDTPMPIIATQDIAAFALKKLIDLDFTGKTVQALLGPREYTQNEIASIFGNAIGMPDLKYVQFPYEDAKHAMMQMGMSSSVAQGMVDLQKSINEGPALAGHTRDTLGTTPTTIESFAAIFKQVFESMS
jgi:uncharacterized protein YbjT (DUF2867 family)